MDSYYEHALKIEERQQLAAYAKKSFEVESASFVDGDDAKEYYERLWRNDDTALKLRNRTPLQIERDRILYSSILRKQTDKYHVLYSGSHRIVRNYTTHTMRMTQVVRSICRPLYLNSDFAEALALGAKVGASPFIHAAKEAVAKWLEEKIASIDKERVKGQETPASATKALQLELFASTSKGRPNTKTDEPDYPQWIERLQSEYVIKRVKQYIPWARGRDVNLAYSSGQESYWLLSVNPFTCETREGRFFPETMYGIWRHNISNRPLPNSFHHRLEVASARSGYHDIRWSHATYESAVVQYADDITWTIENLNDANRIILASGQPNLFFQLLRTLQGDQVPATLLRALSAADSGALYTYFIESFIDHAGSLLSNPSDREKRDALREGDKSSFLTLPEEVENQLNRIKTFLDEHVFKERRVMHRTQMLKNIVSACLDILYEGQADLLPKMIEERSKVEEWKPDEVPKAKQLLADDVHRAQLAVDMFADMGDQEIYDFVGIQSL